MNTARNGTTEAYWTHFYRATPKARLPGITDSMRQRSPYLHDILLLCMRGAWELELRQFMPPASLCDTVRALLEMGLIERLEQAAPSQPAAGRPRSSFIAPSHRDPVPA